MEENTGMAAAFRRAGVENPEDISKFSSAEVADLTKKLNELTLTDPTTRVEALKAHAEEQAEILSKAYQNRSKIRNIRRENELPEEMFAEEEANAQAMIDLIENPQTGNIFAARLNRERVDALHLQQRNERFAARDAREKDIFSRATEGFTLHMACGSEDGTYALLYRPQIIGPDSRPVQRRDKGGNPMTNPDGSPMIATKRHVVLLLCSGGSARVLDSTQRSVVEKMGDREVRLLPDEDFETPRGEPFFSLPIKEALTRRFKAEKMNASRQEMTAKREISFTDGKNKKGVAVAHWPPQRPYLSGKRKGPLSVVVSFTGKGNFELEEVFSSEFEDFLTPAIGKKLSLELPEEPAADADEETRKAFQRHKFLVNLINRRVEYEARVSAREAEKAELSAETDVEEAAESA